MAATSWTRRKIFLEKRKNSENFLKDVKNMKLEMQGVKLVEELPIDVKPFAEHIESLK